MRKVGFVLFIMIVIFNGCSDEDDNSLSKSSLYQTQWHGYLQFKEDNNNKECNLNISFETLSTGSYISENLSEDSKYSKQTSLEYSVDNKIITIYGGVNNLLLGDWWIEKTSNKSITLKRESNTKYESVLVLNKLYL